MLPVGINAMAKEVVVVRRSSAGFGFPDNNMLAGNDLGEVNGVEAGSNLVAGGAEDLQGA